MGHRIPETMIKKLLEDGEITKWDVFNYRISRYPLLLISIGGSIGAGFCKLVSLIAHHFVKF
jgi:hypothetical protein